MSETSSSLSHFNQSLKLIVSFNNFTLLYITSFSFIRHNISHHNHITYQASYINNKSYHLICISSSSVTYHDQVYYYIFYYQTFISTINISISYKTRQTEQSWYLLSHSQVLWHQQNIILQISIIYDKLRLNIKYCIFFTEWYMSFSKIIIHYYQS